MLVLAIAGAVWVAPARLKTADEVIEKPPGGSGGTRRARQADQPGRSGNVSISTRESRLQVPLTCPSRRRTSRARSSSWT